MATLRDIRRRIGSVSSTMQITNAMKMVSTAKLSRAQNAVRSAQPYAQVLRRMVISMSAGLTGEDHPFFQTHEGGGTAVLLFTSDRGLCGAFNANLCKNLLRGLMDPARMPEPELTVFGRKGADFFRRRGYTIAASAVQMSIEQKAARIPEMLGAILERFNTGEIGRVMLAHNRFQSAMTQHPAILPLLPIVPPEGGAETGEAETGKAETGKDQGEAREERETLFEPSRSRVLEQLLPAYLENQLFGALLNTEAGEHGARMVAMDGATRNAKDMISSLTLQANKARQASITKELIEIVSGAEAL